jgi:orotate phosphoribosyltransferase
MHLLQSQVARALLMADAVRFTPDQPVTFKSGIRSPIYVDNRRLLSHPEQWRVVIVAMHEMLQAQDIDCQVIAGIETAGIPHSAVLAYTMRRPSVFVRKAAKDHGMKQRVEGGDVTGKRVLLIEDMITTGSSSLSGVHALRESGAVVEDCLSITSYNFREAIDAFTELGVRLHTLTTFPVILAEAEKQGMLGASVKETVQNWLHDPHGWTGL